MFSIMFHCTLQQPERSLDGSMATKESERLCRLPMYYSLSLEEAAEVVKALKEFPEYETIEDR